MDGNLQKVLCYGEIPCLVAGETFQGYRENPFIFSDAKVNILMHLAVGRNF
jgi:hypothetical protein